MTLLKVFPIFVSLAMTNTGAVPDILQSARNDMEKTESSLRGGSSPSGGEGCPGIM